MSGQETSWSAARSVTGNGGLNWGHAGGEAGIEAAVVNFALPPLLVPGPGFVLPAVVFLDFPMVYPYSTEWVRAVPYVQKQWNVFLGMMCSGPSNIRWLMVPDGCLGHN